MRPMSATSHKRILGNFTALGIVQGTNYLIPLLVMPYVIGKIGPEGFGEVAVAQVVMMFFTNIADYGFNLTATRDVTHNRGNRDLVSKIFFNVLITRLLICLVLFILLLAGISLIPFMKASALLYILAFTTVIGQSIVMNWLFQAIEQMKLIMYISLFARIVFVLLVVGFIKTRADNIYFIFFTGVGNLLAGVVSIFVAFRLLKLKVILPRFADVAFELKNGWHITVSNLSVSIYMYANVLILRLFTGNEVVGYYSIAEKIVTAARQVLIVYFQVIYPQICQLAVSSKQGLSAFLKRYYLPFVGAVLAGCFFLFFFSDWIVGIFIKDNVHVSSYYLRILSFVPLIVCLNIPAYQVLLAHDQKKSLLKIFFSGTVINILLNVLLVKATGPTGTCYTILVTETLITLGLVYEMFRFPETNIFNYEHT